MSKIRLSSHPLRIETGRYGRNRIDRNERLCLICGKNDIEDEYHFVLNCDEYSTIRDSYIKEKWRKNPSVFKLTCLLKSKDTDELVKLAKYVKFALEKRNTIINRQI